jgi:hypothetical protein
MALGRRLFVSGHWLIGSVPASNVEFYRAIFSGSLCILVALLVPETYGPLLLKRRAQELSKQSQALYVSKLDKDEQQITLGARLKVALSRPWLMLLHEPIVLILTIYTALLYGTVTRMLCYRGGFADKQLVIYVLRRLSHCIPRPSRLE